MLKITKRLLSSYKWSYVNGTSTEPLIGLTLPQLIDQSAEKFPQNEALISCHQNIRKTFQEVKTDSEKLASGLLALGLEKGDRIGIWGPNSYEWYQTQMAASKAGLILVNVNPAYKSQELNYCINKVGIKALISARSFRSSDYFKTFNELKSEDIPTLKYFVMFKNSEHDEIPSAVLNFAEILNAGSEKEVEKLGQIGEILQMDDPVNIQFTSGTTGSPKGACLSHHNIVNNGKFIGLRIGYDKKIHRICCAPPFYHCFGCVIGNVTAMIYGAAMVLPGPHFNATDCMKAVEKEKCTSIYGTPTMFTDMIQIQRFDLIASEVCQNEKLNVF